MWINIDRDALSVNFDGIANHSFGAVCNTHFVITIKKLQ
jgi:hypothetical protein